MIIPAEYQLKQQHATDSYPQAFNVCPEGRLATGRNKVPTDYKDAEWPQSCGANGRPKWQTQEPDYSGRIVVAQEVWGTPLCIFVRK